MASMEDRLPLMVERLYGRGKVLLFSTLPQPDWCNLYQRRFFIPLMARTVSYLSGGGPAASGGNVGEALSLGNGTWDEHRPPQVIRPDNKPVEATVHIVDGEPRANWARNKSICPAFTQCTWPAIPSKSRRTTPWPLRSASSARVRPAIPGWAPPAVFAVNIPRRESIPDGLDLDAQRGQMGKWVWPAGDKTRPAAEAVAGLLDHGQVGRGVWDALLGLVLALLLIEPLVANRFVRSTVEAPAAAEPALPERRRWPDVSAVAPGCPEARFHPPRPVDGSGARAGRAGRHSGVHGGTAMAPSVVDFPPPALVDASLVRGRLPGVRLAAPHLGSSAEEQSTPLMAVLLDNSRSMARPFASQSGSVSRYAKALAVLHEQVQPALDGKYRLKLFDVRGEPLDAAHLPPSPEVATSPIVAGLANVQHELAGQPLAGILLLSDGIENSERPGIAASEPLRVPVYPIDVAQPHSGPAGPPDLILQAVATNRTALVGNMVRVTVDIGATGDTHSAQVPLAILDAGRVIATSTIQWRPEQPLLRTQLDFAPTRAGNFTYTVQLGKLPGETNLENNRKTFSLTVHAKALKVLYVDGVLRFEGKFIREALDFRPRHQRHFFRPHGAPRHRPRLAGALAAGGPGQAGHGDPGQR